MVRSARTIPTVAVVAPSAKPARLEPLEAAGVEILRSPDLTSALRSLRDRGVTSLLVEGGGRLSGALLAADVVDRFYWVQSPLWLGIGSVPAVAGMPTALLTEAPRWRVSQRRALGEDTLLVVDRR
jgi:diaminohydroxyphosphoribosylaminopyrimidine deaminase/5-amino-6-(5-phosphoribosylamino)uracil reductase